MKNFLAATVIAICALALVGCQTSPQLIKEQLRVIVPPESLYKCEKVKVPRNAGTLTEGDVAKLLVYLKRTNVECYNSLMAIKSWASQAKRLAQ